VALRTLCITRRLFKPTKRCASETTCARTVLPSSITTGQEICCSAYLLQMASVCLDSMSFWTPPVAADLAAASHLQQRHDDPSPSSSEPTSAPIDEHTDDLWDACGQSLDQPILIPSDIESDMFVAGGSDTKQDDGGESDSSLPSLEALVARQATPRRGNASRRGTLVTGTVHFGSPVANMRSRRP
jgi:hypothetical protein